MIQNPPDLHKLFVRFSQPKSFFDEYERLHAFVSHTMYNIGVRAVSDIQSLAFGSSLYIRYSTAAHVVNSTYNYILSCIRLYKHGRGHEGDARVDYRFIEIESE